MILLGGSWQTVPVMAGMGNGSFGQPITGITKNIADTIPDTFGDREMTFILELLHNKTEINEKINKKIDN